MTFYELQGPTAWVDPPTVWSSTSLDDVEACPRRWQLLRSRWGDFDRFPVRPHPAAVEGQIVHEALDRLTRSCGQRGNPPFGSAEFSAALSDADFFPGFARVVAEWQHQLASHPRPGPAFYLRASGEELANRAVRMFREQYKPDGNVAKAAERASEKASDLKGLLARKRALSEVKLTHPQLAFLGVLDRVQRTEEGVEVVDFKTGKPSYKHRTQLLRYALLWWRNTGDMPIRITAQYLDGCDSWVVENADLIQVEAWLTQNIAYFTETLRTQPAPAKTSAGCQTCPVRSRCAAGWAIAADGTQVDGRGDAELVADASAGEHGFLAHSRKGVSVSVVYEAGISRLLPAHIERDVLRVLNGVWRASGTELEIKPWTEVFLVSAAQRQ